MLQFVQFIKKTNINFQVLVVASERSSILLFVKNTSSDTISIAWECNQKRESESFKIEFAVASVSYQKKCF